MTNGMRTGSFQQVDNFPTVTQSKYYSPAFNAAIFDGPLRIYFAQYQESEALKIYFKLQEQLKERSQEVRDNLRGRGSNVFVMLYPTKDIFQRSFEEETPDGKAIIGNPLGKDYVLGLNGPLEEKDYDLIFDKVNEYVSASA